MSASAILLPIAISIIAASVAPAKAKKRLADARAEGEGAVRIETRFADAGLLLKTLHEHGVQAHVRDNGDIVTRFDDGRIVYKRLSADGPYVMEVSEVRDIDRLIGDLDCIESEYNGNVQTYTCERVKTHLPDGMTVKSEELMPDNSILITIDID